MDQGKLQITKEELTPKQEDRFQRFSLIGWWTQERIRNAKVLVIGAGALGNEIIKNLALLGFGKVFVADLDRIENSNLSRSVLYREKDNGSSKAYVAANSAKDLYPDIQVQSFHGNILYDLGLGVYNWADIVIGGLDNREARLSINRACWKLDKTWVDGAIEQLSGIARVFFPDGPCYECTMSEVDWQLLNRRRSCNLLSRQEMQEGKIPTTPTISAIIAGIQCQEAVKYLHGMETIAGKGIVFNGITADSYIIEYQRNPDCYSHDTADQVYPIQYRTSEVVLRDLLDIATQRLGEGAVLELSRDVLESFYCPKCELNEEMFVSLGAVQAGSAVCPECGINREIKTFYLIHGHEEFCSKTFAEIGIPNFDIVWARNRSHLIGFEFAGDAEVVLGPLSS